MFSTASQAELSRDWRASLNKAYEVFFQKKRNECADALRAVHDDDAYPLNFFVEGLILLGRSADDWKEAYSCYVKATTYWHLAIIQDTNIEKLEDTKSLRVLRDALWNLRADLLEEEARCHESIQNTVAEQVLLQDLRENSEEKWARLLVIRKDGQPIRLDGSDNSNELSDDDEMIDAKGPGDTAEEHGAKSEENTTTGKSMADDTRNCKGCSKNLEGEATAAEHQATCILYQVKIACNKVKAEERKRRKADVRKMREKMSAEMRETRQEMESKLQAIRSEISQEETTMRIAMVKNLKETMTLLDGQKAALQTHVEKVEESLTKMENKA